LRIARRSREKRGFHLEEYEQWLTATFRSDFYAALCDWRVPKPDAVLAAEHLVEHAEIFKMPLPQVGCDGAKKHLNTREPWEMLLKLIDLKIAHMDEVHKLLTCATSLQSVAQRNDGIDSVIRYVTSATRELERAYDWYLFVSRANRT